nr:hypothetical protein [Polaromonas sp.]
MEKIQGRIQILLCSDCFVDEGLRIDALKHGLEQEGNCAHCNSSNGRKLTKDHIKALAWRFFVNGKSLNKNSIH